MDHFSKLTELVTRISQISANLGFQAATTGKKFIEPDVKLELEIAHIHLMLMYEELLRSRDDYQKAADSLAAENKMLRESKSKPSIKIAEIIDGFCKQPHNTQYVKVFESGVRFAEKYHGIGGNE